MLHNLCANKIPQKRAFLAKMKSNKLKKQKNIKKQ